MCVAVAISVDVSVVDWVDDERMMLFCKMGVVGGVNDLTINNGSRNDTQKHCLIRSIMMTFQSIEIMLVPYLHKGIPLHHKQSQ